jgi:signal transduction histidine kinase/PAS domain-containing protein
MATLLHVHATSAPSVGALAALRAEGVTVVDAAPDEHDVARTVSDDVVAAVIASDVEAPVAIARTIHRHSPDAHIVFVTTEHGEPRLRRDLMFAPRIGKHWSVAQSEDAEQMLRTAISTTEKRRSVQAALGRMNVRLAVPVVRRPIVTEELVSGILDQLSDGVVALDLDGIVLTHNAAAARLFGNSLSRGATFAVPEGEMAIEGLTVDVRSSAITDDNGRAIGSTIVARDVTERKREEDRRRFIARAVSILSSSIDIDRGLQHLAELVVQRFATVCVIDVGEEETFSRRAVAGSGPHQARVSALWEFGPNQASDHPSIIALRQNQMVVRNDLDAALIRRMAMNDEHAAVLESIGISAAVAIPLRAGTRTVGVMLLAKGEPFSGDDLEAIEDLARNAAASLQNAWLYRAAEEANRAKDEFLATVSHELRTPMTSILGWIQMLRIGDLEPEMADDAMEAIERSARAQAQLIDDLLDLSRIQMGKLHLQTCEVDLGTVVRGAVDTVRPAAEAKQIDLRLTVSGATLINGDPNRLQQVVWNLLSNAVKFTDKGGAVTVSVESRGSRAQVHVSDSGHGIAPDFLPFVFERFRQADSSITRRFGGLGLGLSIVRQIVELHGGTVAATSAGVGKGATFSVTLPLIAVRAPAEAGAPVPKLADLGGLRILVVDDEPSAARVICTVLEQAGAKVETKPSVADALEEIRRSLPDILVSDVAMPDQDGLALISHVRNVLRIPAERLPAIALTAMNDTDTRVRILGAGFQRFVSKPADAQKLTETVARVAKRM